MKLVNLFDVADTNVNIIMSGIKSDGSEVGFNFKTMCWMEDNRLSPDRVSSIKEFKRTKFYRSVMMHKRIEDFSVFHPGSIESLREVEFYQNKVLKIKVYIVEGKSNIRQAIEARIDYIARGKQIPTRKPKRRPNNNYRNKKRKNPNNSEGSTTSHTDVGSSDSK